MKSYKTVFLFFVVNLFASFYANGCEVGASLQKLLDAADSGGVSGVNQLRRAFSKRVLSDSEIYGLMDDIVGNVPSHMVGDVLSSSTALKEVYPFVGSNDALVLAVAKLDTLDQAALNAQLLKEVKLLDDLDFVGVPVVRFSADTVTYSGRPAYMMERMLGSSRELAKSINVNGKLVAKENSGVLSEVIKLNKQASLDSLGGIRSAIISADIEIQDIQFLFDKNGRFVVNDPEGVISAVDGGNVAASVKKIDDLIEYVTGL